jgi:hypothetical protein
VPPPPGHGISPTVIAAAGAGLGLLVVAALVVFLVGRGGGSSHAASNTPPQTAPSQNTPPAAAPTGTTGTGAPITTGGQGASSLQSQFPATVSNGSFGLDPNSFVQDTAVIGQGATDAFDAAYSDNAGNQVTVTLASFADTAAVQNQFNGVTSALGNAACQRAGSSTVNQTSTGRAVGQVVIFDCSNTTNSNLAPGQAVWSTSDNLIVGSVGAASTSSANSFASSFIGGGP